jgi:hypothetical protein
MAKLESVYRRIATSRSPSPVKPTAAENKFEFSGRVKLFTVFPGIYGGDSSLVGATKRLETIFCNGTGLSDTPPTDFSLSYVRLVLPITYTRFANSRPNINIPGGYILFEDGLTLYTGNGSSTGDRPWLGNITLLMERG